MTVQIDTKLPNTHQYLTLKTRLIPVVLGGPWPNSNCTYSPGVLKGFISGL